ncbi:extracellular calcium-sensing receptor-like [Carassius auratus]|uniref:Extracellular calcium-sensing receptor-like n=1 Tax=Carassius auratus TaxID=7957 RepID=A0A6P6RBM3_CARAU|nr:extracellular calcium-sensing receptor-like [Carassius auratus]
MVFAIEEINNRADILPGISLGYKVYDSCGSIEMALRASLSLINGDNASQLSCQRPNTIQAIIAETSSTPTIAISSTVGPLHLPVISHFATCACLSDRKKHPSFFRTIPSDYYQSQALAKLVKYFGWTWVGALCSDNDYGNNGMNTFIKAATEFGVCVEFSEAFFRTDPREDILRIVDIVKKSSSKVIVAFVSYSDMDILLGEIAQQNITGLQWIGSESWISDMNIATGKWHQVLRGSMGFAIPKAEIRGLREFLTNLNQSSDIPLYKELWETLFQCKLPPQETTGSIIMCEDNESLNNVQNQYTDVTELQIANNVYKAVYAVAYALNNTISCKKWNTKQSKCLKKVINALREVSFFTETGEKVFFDKNGDPAARYDLLNWQQGEDGTIKFVKVGFYDASLQPEFQLSFNNISIVWAKNQRQVPVSECNESCPTGTRKAVKKGKPVCCYDCITCAEGEISNKTGMVQKRIISTSKSVHSKYILCSHFPLRFIDLSQVPSGILVKQMERYMCPKT